MKNSIRRVAWAVVISGAMSIVSATGELMRAVKTGNVSLVRSVYSSDPDQAREIGYTEPLSHDHPSPDQGFPIHAAAYLGHIEIVQFLLEQDPELLNVKSQRFARTPLRCAVARKHADLTKMLIEMGADTDVVLEPLEEPPGWHAKMGEYDERDWQTTLETAVVKNDVEIVNALLNAGCRVSPQAIKRALNRAIQVHENGFAADPRIEVLKVLLIHPRTKELWNSEKFWANDSFNLQRGPLHVAVNLGSFPLIALLCDAGVNVLHQDAKGDFPVDTLTQALEHQSHSSDIWKESRGRIRQLLESCMDQRGFDVRNHQRPKTPPCKVIVELRIPSDALADIKERAAQAGMELRPYMVQQLVKK